MAFTKNGHTKPLKYRVDFDCTFTGNAKKIRELAP